MKKNLFSLLKNSPGNNYNTGVRTSVLLQVAIWLETYITLMLLKIIPNTLYWHCWDYICSILPSRTWSMRVGMFIWLLLPNIEAPLVCHIQQFSQNDYSAYQRPTLWFLFKQWIEWKEQACISMTVGFCHITRWPMTFKYILTEYLLTLWIQVKISISRQSAAKEPNVV